MPRKGTPVADPNALEGLAKAWDKVKSIRGHMLKTGNLMRWPSPNKVGCINFETMSLNHKALAKLLRIWLPQIDTLHSVNIFACRQEVGLCLGILCRSKFVIIPWL